ncbi:MAG TPA: cupin domain-containing protein [Burkholderiales bacterium]|nr:cupin domain-containing protein [Burkholderiales bacterium]
MSGLTPNAKRHESLPPLASRFVEVAKLPWEKTRFAGVEMKTLLVDRETGLVTSLMRFAPGARLPDHEHVLIEQTYVLEGSLVCGEGECKAGDYVWRPSGSRHEAWAGPGGGLMLAMFQIPNRFFENDGRETDVTGQDWNATWSKALFR